MSAIDRPLATPVATLVDNLTHEKYNFPFNINSLNWTYQINTRSYDTIGGRVTQIVSARATIMSLQGEAGSRANLLELYKVFKTLQDHQNQSKMSMTLNVPSRNLSYRVWLEMMQIGWDISTTTYPYNMSFEIEQDLSTNQLSYVSAAINKTLDNIAGNIGFNPQWNGLATTESNLTYSDLTTFVNALKGNG